MRPIIIASDKTWNIVDSALKQTHTYWQGHRIWWPMEDYKVFADCPPSEIDPVTGAADQPGRLRRKWRRHDRCDEKSAMARSRCTLYSLQQLPEDLGTLARWLIEPDRRNALLDIFLNRDYTHYVQVRNADRPPEQQIGPHTPDNWPLVSDFRIYVRNDLADKIWTEALGTAQPLERSRQAIRTRRAGVTWRRCRSLARASAPGQASSNRRKGSPWRKMDRSTWPTA